MPEGRRAKPKRRKVVAGIVAAVAVVAFAAVGVMLYGNYQSQREYEETHTLHNVPIALVAPDYDSQADSRIPVSILGIDLDGEVVDRCYYLSPDQNRIPLMQGTYRASVPASPLLSDGSIYQVPDKTYFVTVDDEGKLSKPLRFTFEKAAPESITDEMISSSYEQALLSGVDAKKAEATVGKVSESRKAALESMTTAELEKKEEEKADPGTSAEEVARKSALANLFKPWNDQADELKANFDKDSDVYFSSAWSVSVSELHLAYLPSGELVMHGKLSNEGEPIKQWWLDVWVYNDDGTKAYARFDSGDNALKDQAVKKGEAVEFTLRPNKAYETSTSPREYAHYHVGELTVVR